jgi:hypothetical protein
MADTNPTIALPQTQSQDEEWRPVAGYEGLYEISNWGRVKSLLQRTRGGQRKRDKILKLVPNRYGYFTVGLYDDSTCRRFTVHKLVAITFLPPSDNPARACINHKDGNKQYNHYNNLEWCTNTENIQHSIAIGLRPIPAPPERTIDLKGSECWNSKLIEEQVIEIKRMILNGSGTSEIAPDLE